MKIEKDADLSKLTTVHIGGIAKELIIPESISELVEIINIEKIQYFIGGGSNLLIADKIFEKVVSLREFDKSIVQKEDGVFIVGGSVRLQNLINTINKLGYGGIEYLYSVPGLVGGAVAMNAGGSIEEGRAISDYIIRVDCIRDGERTSLNKEECGFSHRNSLFKIDPKIIVCSVKFQFPHMDKKISEVKKKERLDFCRKTHDLRYPNFGSVFRVYNPYIVYIIRHFESDHSSGVHFSRITDNWICNNGNGTFKEAIKQINKVKFLHKILFQKCLTEVIIWQ